MSENPSFRTRIIRDVNPLSGGDRARVIYEPNQAMRILHFRFMRYLRGLDVDLPFATGARAKDSPSRNVIPHLYNRYFYILDLHNAYGNVNGHRLAAILHNLDKKLAQQEKAILEFLNQFCLSQKTGLIVGGPASPDLFNLYAGVLIDNPMEELCKEYGLTYTRYLDDLTLSSPTEPIGNRKRKAIRKIIEKAGFDINHRKSRVYDLAKGSITINGIGLELEGRVFLPRHYLRTIRGLLHRAQKTLDPNLIQRLNGMMGVFWAVKGRRPKGLLNRWRGSNRIEYKLITAHYYLLGQVPCKLDI